MRKRKSGIHFVRSLLSLLCAFTLFSCGISEESYDVSQLHSVTTSSPGDDSNIESTSTVNDQLSTQHTLTENDLLELKQERNSHSDRIFTYWGTESNDVTYYIEQSSISTRQEALAVIQAMEEEVSALKSLISQYSSESLSIWVVERDFASGRELMDSYINQNRQIVTSPELMKNGDYLNAVARILLDLSSPLLSYGLAEYIHPSPLAEILSVYYNRDNNKTVLDLLPIRFLKSIAGDEAAIARQTAGELLKYTIQTYGFKEAIDMLDKHTFDLTELKQEWLKYIGVENSQYSSFAEGLWEQFDVSPGEDGYDLLVTTNSADYHFKFVKQDVQSLQTPVPIYLINAENVIRFLIDNERGLQDLKSLIRSSAYASSFHLSDKPDYYIDESQTMNTGSSYGSYTDSYSFDKPAIFLSLPVEIAHIHEAFHAMEPNTDDELFNRRYAIDSYAAASLDNDPDAKDAAAYSFYFESWASFLVDTYSFDHLLGVLVGEATFKEAFGMSFDETQVKWQAYLAR